MKQVFVSSKMDTTGIAECFSNPCVLCGWDGDEENARAPWPIPGTFRNLRVVWSSSATETATFRKGAAGSMADTALAASVSGATVGTSASEATVAAGDLVSLKMTAGSPVISHSSIEFEGDNPRESGYINSTPFGPGIPGTSYQPLFRGNRNWSGSITNTYDQNVVPIPGVVGAIYWHVSVAPGSGNSWTFTIYVNGVAQDGTGGTPDTRVTIADTDIQGNATFSLTLAPGDLVAVQAVTSGTPAGSGSMNIAWGVKFTADTDGYSIFCGQTSATLNTGATAYQPPANFNNASWDTTEADNEEQAGLTAFDLRGLVVALVNAPGAGDSYVFAGRVNSATPAGAPSVTVADTDDTGTDDGAMTVSPGDTFALQAVPSGTPASGGMAWAFGQFIEIPEIRGSLVAGVKTTVTATRAIAFGLDNNTNTHDEAGTFRVFGHTKLGGGALGTGAVAAHGARMMRNTSGNGAAGTLQLVSAAGTVYYLWVDATGDLRIHTAAPTEDGSVSDTAGSVVGGQS